MPDYPASVLAAAETAIRAELKSSREVEPDRLARAALDAAAPVLAEAVAQKVADLRSQVDHMRQVLERKNRLLDALHVVWCDGGCPGGVHRYQDADVLVTEELVVAAERNTARLRDWYEAVKFRYETYGPDPADPSRQFPSTASEWHRQYAARAAARTDLAGAEGTAET